MKKLSENLKPNIELTIICVAAGSIIYALGLAEVLWQSVLIGLAIGFTTRYGTIWLHHISPQINLRMRFIIAGLIALGLWGLLPLMARQAQRADVDLWHSLPLLLISGLATLVICYFYYSREQFFLLQQTLDKAEINRVKQEMEALEFRWRQLQSQLEPHFLFNTLASIQALIKIEPQQASKMLLALTSLLRQNLKSAREDWMTLADELEFNKAYLSIQKIRLGARLKVHFDISDQVRDDLLVPPMLLQPMIENAVIHGIEPLQRGGELQLKITVVDQQLRIQLYNDGSLAGENGSHRGHNIGLNNTRERLRHLYGETARFSIGEQVPQGVLVKMEVPCRYITAP